MTHHEHNDDAQGLCPACEIGPFIRNNYFTGKLMLERDFTDEQRYFIEKIRHHHQRLHGWGVVCGLKVKQYPNAACRDRFICIEPGTAIDCCGHEIVVHEEECIDITQLPSIKALIDKKDKRPHTLQICLRYRECPTEEIPVLYDECGCDDTKCAPNRILESYEVDVMVDPKDEPQSFHTPNLKWHCTANPPHAYRTVLHADSKRLYALTSDSNVIYQIETETYRVVGSRTLAAKGLTLAASNDGKRIYVVTEPKSGAPGDPRQLIVLDTADHLTKPPLREFDIPHSAGDEVFLAVAPVSDNRLFALLGKKGDVLVWPTTLDTGSGSLLPSDTIHLVANLHGLVIGSTALKAFTADAANNQIRVLDIASKTEGVAIDVLPANFKPSALALVVSTAPDMLAVVSQSLKQIALLNLDSGANADVAPLAYEPIDLAISLDGQWAYVLEQDGDQSFIQPVSLYRLQLKSADASATPFKIGDKSQQIAAMGGRLYIPFKDTVADPKGGGIAVVEVTEQDCEDILWRHLEGCPQCDTPNCVVLATIENYHVGDRIEETNIDNRKGRRLLPNTQALTAVVKCLLEHGTGGGGTRGLPGAPGKDGKDGAPGVGERGPAGPTGPGLEKELTQIVALSWAHNKRSSLVPITDANQTVSQGMVIGFSSPVSIPNETQESAADHVFQVLVQHDLLFGEGPRLGRRGVICRCPVIGKVISVKPDTVTGRITSATVTNSPDRGLAFVFDNNEIGEWIRSGIDNNDNPIELWIRLRGDFVIDAQDRAIDAEFVRAELPTGDRPKNSKVGIQGGTFESWFKVGKEG